MRSLTIFGIAAVVMTGLISMAWAKRMPPPVVSPVKVGTVEYRAPVSRMGCIEAYDSKTSETWWRQIYVVVYVAGMEKDVQDVFIKQMKLENGSLHIVNERGDECRMDLKTLQVEVVKGALIVKQER